MAAAPSGPGFWRRRGRPHGRRSLFDPNAWRLAVAPVRAAPVDLHAVLRRAARIEPSPWLDQRDLWDPRRIRRGSDGHPKLRWRERVTREPLAFAPRCAAFSF